MKQLIQRLLRNEIIRYTIAGGVVTLTNAIGYFLLLEYGVLYTTANVISLILSKTVGYFLNKFWVYHSHTASFYRMVLELLRFIIARAFTGLIDFFGVIMLVEFIGMGERVSKIIIMVIVIALNYILGKKAVFKEGDKKNGI